MSDPISNTMLARSGASNPDGKLTHRLDIPVTEATQDAATAAATIAGMTKAEYLRLVIERHFFGELSMIRRMAHTPGARRSEESGSHVG